MTARTQMAPGATKLLSPTLRIAAVFAATLLLALSAHVQVPGYPVKISMQTAAVFAIGIALGSRLGVAAVLAYIAEGLAGLPVFQNGAAGPAYLFGPTGGYLAGFVLAAFIAGRAAETGRMTSFAGSVAVLLVATIAIYALGVAWLAILLGFEKAVAVGVLPFLFGDALKVLLVAGLVAAGVIRPLRRLAARR
ncbi:MAG: biotin transporter BioY [Mesorhizobium sp.]